MKARFLGPVTPFRAATAAWLASCLGAQEAPPDPAAIERAVRDLAALSQPERDAAIDVLVAAGPAAMQPLGALIGAADTGAVARYAAWQVLRRSAPLAAPLRELLLDIVDGDRFGARKHAAEIVAAIDLEGARAIAARAAGTQMSAQHMRMAIESAAARGAEPAIEALVPLHFESNRRYRSTVDDWLTRLGRHAETDATGRALARMMAGDDAEARLAAIDALGRIGIHAVPAADVLLARLAHEPDRGVQSRIVTALRAAGPTILPELRRALHDAPAQTRALLIHTLGGLGADAVPIAVEALADADPAARFAAVVACTTLGADAIPALRDALDDDARRTGAIAALRRAGPPAHAAIERLRAIAASDSTDALRARAALEAIER